MLHVGKVSYRKEQRHLAFFMYGAMRLTRLVMPRPLVGTISLNRRLVRFGVTRRRWLFPILVRTNLPVPVRRKRFDVALWVFILYFLVLFLRGTVLSSLTQNTADYRFFRGWH